MAWKVKPDASMKGSRWEHSQRLGLAGTNTINDTQRDADNTPGALVTQKSTLKS